ncbi:MAG: single-stranded-DNA-specific exonuclease RecJ [Clostridiales bacterium]|nr:single-stranded-DNA-specific exonuclease RecJ [Clostridiales bacterium]
MTVNPKILEIIESRGIGEEMLEEFFSPKPKLAYDPFLLANMREGVDSLLKAVDEGKRIVIYGDYDVDGITSTALLMKVIGTLTGNVTYYIPSRLDEGYGLHREAIDRISEDGGEFIVTVDCGSTSSEETAYAHSLGIDTLVTDHHNMSDQRAEGIVINPRQPEDTYPFKGLAGVGVAYKLALAIARERNVPGSLMAEMLEFATVGTIADIMPMIDENRTIVKCGLRSIHLGCRNRGLRELIDRSALDYKTLKAGDISFGIAPKINASGRLGDASLGVKLLLSENEQEIRECCSELIEANRERRRLQDAAYEKGCDMLDDELAKGDFVIVEINDSHEGVLGIVAGKLREKINRPVVVISGNGDTYKGTGRSIPGVDLFGMLDKYRDSFISFGGHSAACGFTIDADGMDRLRKDLNRDIESMRLEEPDLLKEKHMSDAEIDAGEIDMELAEALQLLEPCGKDNEVPVFVIRNAEISGWRFLKDDDKMARFSLVTGDGRHIDAVIFRNAAEAYEAVTSGKVDVFCNIEVNTWRDVRKAQVIVKEIVPAGAE